MCEKLRIPVVFLTALIAAEIEQSTKPTGLIGCLNKPFRDHDLLRLVGKSFSGEPVERSRAL
jgi:FixJ family two-component response regulator